MQSVPRYVALTLGFLLALPAGAATAGAPEKVTIAGLSQPVEILKDRWGISHIYAKNEADLFFAQGYNVAHDRLFQLELWRRQATGTCPEILGPKELKRDIGNRLFMYRGDLNQELNWYHPRGAAIIQAFVDGVNAYIAETRKNPALLTPEFKMLGIKPGKWTPAVVISRFNGLLGNIDEEMNMALAVRTIGAEKVKDLDYFQPANPDLKMDPAIDTSLLSKNILELYHAFRTPIKFTPRELAAAYRGQSQAVARLDDSVEVLRAIDLSNRRQDIGSNNWVVGGKLTATGFPHDDERSASHQQTPSLRYWVHLVAPGWDVIGGGEPALPGVSIGHNDFGAWGLTIFGTDSEDLYVYDTNPANPIAIQIQRRLGSHDRDQGIDSGEGPGARGDRSEVHPARAGGLRRQGASQSLCDSRGLARDGRRSVSGQPAHGSGAQLGRIPRCLQLQPHSRREHGVGRPGPQHWLSGGRHRAACVRTGAVWCRFPAMAATNGMATCRSRRCRMC